MSDKIELKETSTIFSGTIVPAGNYMCEQCCKVVIIEKDGTKLPLCDSCGVTTYTKF